MRAGIPDPSLKKTVDFYLKYDINRLNILG
jgi:hypothetical protein